jgi:hypothetical protein
MLATGVSFSIPPEIAAAAAFVSLIMTFGVYVAGHDRTASLAMIATVAFFFRAMMMPSVST